MNTPVKPLKPRKALNKAFLKVKPNRSDIEKFKANLKALLEQTNDTESEEFHKNLVSDFLKKTYYDPIHFINTKGRNDLVIHNGNKANSSVGVILEIKKPTNKSEMPTGEKLNSKAFQELVLYYMRERITQNNLEIKHLVISNIHEWFIFDVSVFERLFAQNKSFVKQFEDFEAERLADPRTDFFYRHVAGPFIDAITQEIEFTRFNLLDYRVPLLNHDPNDDHKLIALFKLLSPEHLLKLPFVNDSNSLDKRFYSELLHIIGLTETKQGGKKLIERNPAGQRNEGSLLENAILQLDSLDKISRLEKPAQYGTNQQERLFNIGLELCISWINRILFLKLMEAQLLSYHKKDKSYEFLSYDKIHNYDALNKLFFQVLARKHDERPESVNRIFHKVPYLNSSLFEPNELEHGTLLISNLEDDYTLPLYSSTVLKDDKGKRRSGSINTLQYLFEFLNAYDFSSEGSEEIQEENKSLINASVLGLIFEKINGYKDGSFFTPGFITMYMCRETIRRTVVQKFNETKGWKCENLDDIYNKIEDRNEANDIINSLKICDPAVGSGHFLVSALNEILAIKSELGILCDRQGRRLRDYHLEVVNDELIITDEEGQIFEYHPGSPESQRVQETLFHEKQTIIENCLFGVDINPNSVKICRLRLWIELLKSAYYFTSNSRSKDLTPNPLSKMERGPGGEELETLPNIDINIKRGNSLVSRFALDADLGQALKKSKWTIDSYRMAVATYRNAENKEQKREMERLIAHIKGDFRSEIVANDPKLKRLSKLKGELFTLTNQTALFEQTQKEKAQWNKKVKKLTDDIQKLETEIEEIKSNKIYENAFEWRFEFPEVLNENGDFTGFDVVIGNPPYFSISNEPDLLWVQNKYSTFSSSGDVYSLFVELSMNILKSAGFSALIISNKWLRANYGKELRKYMTSNTNPIELIDFGQNLLFESAIVHTNIIGLQKNKNNNYLRAVRFPDGFFDSLTPNFEQYIKLNTIENLIVTEEIWNIIPAYLDSLQLKIESNCKKLSDWDIDFYRGILTGYNEAFIINEQTKRKIIEQDSNSTEIIKPILRGRDTRRYYCKFANLWMIATFPSRNYNINEYPALKNYLDSFGKRIEQTGERGSRKKTLHKWFETQDTISYWKHFTENKIIFSEIVSEPQFYYDEKGFYPEATVFFISGEKLKYLTALLNSKAVTFFFKTFYMGGELVGKIRYKKAFLEKVPIPYPDKSYEERIENIADNILEIKEQDPNIDTTILENEIDRLVYELYGLTEEEIGMVENAFK